MPMTPRIARRAWLQAAMPLRRSSERKLRSASSKTCHCASCAAPEASVSAERGALVLFLALLLWAPFPLGSNRAWAWTILEAGLFLCAALWTIGWMQRRHGSLAVVRAAWPAFALLAAWLAYLALHWTPLPAGLVRALSPQAAAVHALAGPYSAADGAWITFSVDPNASFVFWLKSCAWAIAFFLTLALAHTRERARLIAFLLVLSG